MSEFEIDVSIGETYVVDEDAVREAVWYALDVAEAISPAGLTVIVTTAEHVHELNRDYAGIDETTDVLSFGAEEIDYDVEPGDPPYLGDVIIAYPVAERQAQDHDHSVTAELQTLAIHGTLHLLGYDHDTPENQATMWALQSAAMDALRQDK